MSGRVCAQCGSIDNELANGEHLVRPEWRAFRAGEDITPRLRAKGWAPRIFLGRRGMYRDMCLNCLNANEVRDGVWNQLKESARKLEKPRNNPDAEFYAQLCEVN